MNYLEALEESKNKTTPTFDAIVVYIETVKDFRSTVDSYEKHFPEEFKALNTLFKFSFELMENTLKEIYNLPDIESIEGVV